MKERGGQWGFILTPPSQKNLLSKTPALSGSKQYHNHKHNLLHDLKNCLLRKKTPSKNNDYSFTKLFQPGKHENNNKNVITLTRTYNPNIQFSFNQIKKCIKNTANR